MQTERDWEVVQYEVRNWPNDCHMQQHVRPYKQSLTSMTATRTFTDSDHTHKHVYEEHCESNQNKLSY